MKEYRVAIVGATGLVGGEFIKILEQRAFPVGQLRLLASERSAGKTLQFRGRDIEVEETAEDSFEGIDIALFSSGAEVSRRFAPAAAAAGAVVIDNSSAWRMDPQVPLVVPEVNPEDCQQHQGIIANPNCSTIQMVVALHPLHCANEIKRVVVDTYQSVSGTGTPALEELEQQTRALLDGERVEPAVYPHQIAFNMLPEIDLFLDNGFTKEEMKMVNETRKIMHAPTLQVCATCVRVPVFVGHSESVNVEFSRQMSVAEARHVLCQAPGVIVIDQPAKHEYPTPAAAGRDEVFVGRLRIDESRQNCLQMWIVADNIRKGAALNTIQIAETMIERGWL